MWRLSRALLFAGFIACACASAHAGMKQCFEHAARERHVNVNLLYAIGRVESHYRPDASNPKTHAIGIMQVMPWHETWLRRYGISAADLLDACTNINVGTFILADFIRMYGYTWRAVGAYGAGVDPRKDAARAQYAALVKAAYDDIVHPRPAVAAVAHRRATQERAVMVED